MAKLKKNYVVTGITEEDISSAYETASILDDAIIIMEELGFDVADLTVARDLFVKIHDDSVKPAPYTSRPSVEDSLVSAVMDSLSTLPPNVIPLFPPKRIYPPSN